MVFVRYLFPALVAATLWASQLGAQTPTGTITGRVVDSGTTQRPIPDATVIVEGTRRGAITRTDGTFTIGEMPIGTYTVRARRIGFASPPQLLTVPPGGTVTATFALGQRAAILDEVVTTGYGTQRRAASQESVASIDAVTANVGVPSNVSQLIEGRAPGVLVTQNSGEPGAGAQIRIRGGTSISASNEPLYVVDGIPIPRRRAKLPASVLAVPLRCREAR